MTCSCMIALDQVEVHLDVTRATTQSSRVVKLTSLEHNRLATDKHTTTGYRCCLVKGLVEQDAVVCNGAPVTQAEVADAAAATGCEVTADKVFTDIVAVAARADRKTATGTAKTTIVSNRVVMDIHLGIEPKLLGTVASQFKEWHTNADAAMP